MVTEEVWNFPITLGVTQYTFLDVVSGWAGQVSNIYECRENSPHLGQIDWTPHDYLGGLSMRSIVEENEKIMRETTGFTGLIPLIFVTDELFLSITQPDTEQWLKYVNPSWFSGEETPPPEHWWWHRIPLGGSILTEILDIVEQCKKVP